MIIMLESHLTILIIYIEVYYIKNITIYKQLWIISPPIAIFVNAHMFTKTHNLIFFVDTNTCEGSQIEQ